MKKSFGRKMLRGGGAIALLLVLLVSACETEGDDEGDSFDFTPYVGTWKVEKPYYTATQIAGIRMQIEGMREQLEQMGAGTTDALLSAFPVPSEEGDYYTIPAEIKSTLAAMEPRFGWTLVIDSKGGFKFTGEVLDMDTEAYGSFYYDSEEPDVFQTMPTSGVWHNLSADAGGDANGDKEIDKSTLAGFVFYIDKALEENNTIWKMSGNEIFNSVWKKQ